MGAQTVSAKVGCLFARSLRLQLHRRRGDVGAEQAAVLVSRDRVPRVVGVSAAARGMGVRVAMSARAARACAPSAVIVAVERDLYDAGTAELVGALRRISSKVEPVGYGLIYFELGGLGLTGDSAIELASLLVSRLAEVNLEVSVGLAGTKFSSRAAAVFLASSGRRVVAIPGEAQQRILDAVPIEALPLEAAERDSVHGAGLTTLGALRRLGADLLERRFGKRGRWFFELASGEDRRPLVGQPLDEPIAFSVELEPGIESSEALNFSLKRALDYVFSEVASRGLGVRSLVVTIASRHGWRWQRELKAERPTLEISVFLTRFRQVSASLAGQIFPTTLEVSVTGCEPFRPRQSSLFEAAVSAEHVQRLVATLEGICGSSHVGARVSLDSWRPERAFASAPFRPDLSRDTTGGVTSGSSCGFRLFSPPVPLTLTRVIPGTPLSVRPWIDHTRVASVEGPFKLATAWWEDAGEVRRSYFVVSTEAGDHARLFRCDQSERWFADGIYD